MIYRSALCCGIGLVALAASSDAQTVAVPAAEFLSSLGINTHASQGYDYKKYIPALQFLGISVVRDSTGRVPALVALHQQTGVLIDIFNGGDLDGLLSVGHTLAAAGALLSFEGVNEANNFPIVYDGKTGGGSVSWVPVAEFQRDLYARVKADPALQGHPVFHASEGGAELDNVGMQWLTIPPGAETALPPGTKYADYANAHNYVSSNCRGYINNQAWHAADPALSGCWDGMVGEYSLTWAKHYPGYSLGDLPHVPRVTTETGWDSSSDPGGEDVQGKVLVNTYLAQFARGWRYTFVYELHDNEGGVGKQGVYRDDWSPKPAATYIHNLTRILADDRPVKPAGTLDYTIGNKPPTVHELLLQKSTGAFALVVWGEQVEGSSDVVVNLGRKYPQVNIYDVTAGTAPVKTLANADTVPLTMSDHALVVEVIPGKHNGAVAGPIAGETAAVAR